MPNLTRLFKRWLF